MIPTDLIPLSRAAKRLSVSPKRLERLAIAGDFPPTYDIGGALRVSEREVREWLLSREVGRVRAIQDITTRQVREALRSRLDLRRP